MIESQANPHVKHIRSLAADRKDRRRERLFVLEGVRLVADAEASMPYFAADWRQPSALIIGNEAHGLSEHARSLAHSPIGIPMHGRAESLNAAVAGSVILFEALRQRTRGRT